MMEFGFLFWLFFLGLIVACFQDLKRREVDNWLNLFLLSSSFVYLFYFGFFNSDVEFIFLGIASLILLFIFSNLFYYGRIFAGGDSKLLFAMAAFFVAGNLFGTLVNLFLFLVLLMISGSIYGLIYSGVLYFKNSKKVNKEIVKHFGRLDVKFALVVGLIFVLLSYFNSYLLFLGVLIILFPLLFVFAKGLENVMMVKEIPGSRLREGDWLVKDIKVGKKVIRADFEGVSLEDIALLRRKKKVLIKEGLPFVPAFLIAFITYSFFRELILAFVFY